MTFQRWAWMLTCLVSCQVMLEVQSKTGLGLSNLVYEHIVIAALTPKVLGRRCRSP